MQRSSESIGAIAAALAKAQAEITNPEKSGQRQFGHRSRATVTRRSATPRCQRGSISCGTRLAGRRSQPCRPRRLTSRPGSFG